MKNFGLTLSTFFIVLWLIALNTPSDTLQTLLVFNAASQILLFTFVACIPFLITGRMSYVDIAWPFGVAVIGAHILLFADGDPLRKTLIGAVYLFIGLRMGIGALTMAKATGVIFKTEFPRYQYRHNLLDAQKNPHKKLHIFCEIVAQGLANISVLAFPGFMIASNTAPSLSGWEILGLVVWGVAYVLESVADGQKMYFISKHPKEVCNIGLWRYSRHPNYFAEWLVWTGIVIATIPSWLNLGESHGAFVWLILGIGSVCASVMLYITLVYLTGAKPAEYFSVRKRPGYKQYQAETSMFFPWFPKK